MGFELLYLLRHWYISLWIRQVRSYLCRHQLCLPIPDGRTLERLLENGQPISDEGCQACLGSLDMGTMRE